MCNRLVQQSSGSVYAGSGIVAKVTTFETTVHKEWKRYSRNTTKAALAGGGIDVRQRPEDSLISQVRY